MLENSKKEIPKELDSLFCQYRSLINFKGIVHPQRKAKKDTLKNVWSIKLLVATDFHSTENKY